jgi:serine/threonine-protein kinase RsbT
MSPPEVVEIRGPQDVVEVRQLVRARALELKFSLVNQTKVVTAASELARNALVHGGGGQALLESLETGTRRGLRLTFTDQGPGIADIARAMTDGFTTGGGLGLGLSGAKRLCDEFSITSSLGEGTATVITKWG